MNIQSHEKSIKSPYVMRKKNRFPSCVYILFDNPKKKKKKTSYNNTRKHLSVTSQKSERHRKRVLVYF